MGGNKVSQQAVRSAYLQAYRKFLRCGYDVGRRCQLNLVDGLPRYLGNRFRDVAERNRSSNVPAKFILQQAQMVDQYVRSLYEAPANPSCTSILQVLSSGVGSAAYQRFLEKGFVDLIQHESMKRERQEGDEESTSERQNRILQCALQPYAEKLSLLHRIHKDPHYTSTQCIGEVIATRSNVSCHYLTQGSEHLVVEIDDNLNKQTIFVQCSEFNWEADVERAEIAETEEVRRTTFHADYLSIAERLFEALLVETPLHAHRSTVVVGHGVGGAVGVAIALMLHARGFEVRNVLTLGAPKVVQSTLERYISAINPIRVVIAGDPVIDFPVTGSEGDTFQHFGEILVLEGRLDAEASMDFSHEEVGRYEVDSSASGTADEALPASLRLARKNYAEKFSLSRYVYLLQDLQTPLMYAEGDEVWDDGDYRQTLKQWGNEPTPLRSQEWLQRKHAPE